MQLQSFLYSGKTQQWSVDMLPALDSPNTLVLVFAAPHYKQTEAPIQALLKQYPHSIVMGCSTAGEIAGKRVRDDSISVAVMKFEKTPLKSLSIDLGNGIDSLQAGQAIAAGLDAHDLRGIFVLSDGLKINGSELAKGLNSLKTKGVVITGGLAGDGSDFKNTWTLLNGQCNTGFVVAVGFYGDAIRLGHGSKGGWDIFGVERRITRAKNNVLYELDNKPALALYKEYLGEKASELPASGLLFPLAIRKDNTDKNQLVRTILAVNEAEQSLTFAGDMPQGHLAQLMRANFDRLIGGATEASQLTYDRSSSSEKSDSPVLLVAVSCVGRKLLLGERIEEETESTLELFPKGTQQVGFYSYGELSPYATGHCDLHNQTMTLTSIGEE